MSQDVLHLGQLASPGIQDHLVNEVDFRRASDRLKVLQSRSARRWLRLLWLLVGPGVLVMLGENDGPSMVSYATTGATYGIGFFVFFILLTFAMAFVVQEMTVRLGRGNPSQEGSAGLPKAFEAKTMTEVERPAETTLCHRLLLSHSTSGANRTVKKGAQDDHHVSVEREHHCHIGSRPYCRMVGREDRAGGSACDQAHHLNAEPGIEGIDLVAEQSCEAFDVAHR